MFLKTDKQSVKYGGLFMKNNNMTFEEAMKELETVVSRLESGNISLEESISLYKKSIELSGICNKILNDAKQSIEIIKNENFEDNEIDADVITEA